MTTKFAILGGSLSSTEVSEGAIIESLKDALGEEEVGLALPWVHPITPAWEIIYGFLMDFEVPFTLYHSDTSSKPPTRHFRDAEFVQVVKTRDTVTACLEAVDEVLYLWEDSKYNDALLDRIFDHFPLPLVKELTNGLAPIQAIEISDEGVYTQPKEEPKEEPKGKATVIRPALDTPQQELPSPPCPLVIVVDRGVVERQIGWVGYPHTTLTLSADSSGGITFDESS